jgi:hypothetical protein
MIFFVPEELSEKEKESIAVLSVKKKKELKYKYISCNKKVRLFKVQFH